MAYQGLTKWPRLLVAGTPVTREQANQIIIRTTSLWFTVNDKSWMGEVNREFGIATNEHGWGTSDSVRAAAQRLRNLDLDYLTNERVASSWIGGPHGWCDWDGTIGCATYNIGKYPTGEEVEDEWTRIAQAFPYLTLQAQLVTDEGEGVIVAQWSVTGGHVTVEDPGERIVRNEGVSEATILRRLLMAGGERGVSLTRLREAVAQVAAQTQEA